MIQQLLMKSFPVLQMEISFAAGPWILLKKWGGSPKDLKTLETNSSFFLFVCNYCKQIKKNFHLFTESKSPKANRNDPPRQ